MKICCSTGLALLLFSGAVLAERRPGWEFGGEVVYQSSQDLNFDGGSSASLNDDVGLAVTLAYRFTKRLELLLGLDWNVIDYDVNVAPGDAAAGLGFSGSGELESWTPRVGVNFNFLEGNLTPYVTGTVGWSFIDTDIPDGPPQNACWWDPWWGYYCGTFVNTRNIDEFAYGVGAGLRWDVSSAISVHLGYEKHWLDLGEASSTPDFDQVKLGIAARY